MAAVSMFWSWLMLHKQHGNRVVAMWLLIEVCAAALVYSSVPIKLWQELKIIELMPGMVNFNRFLYESGAQILLVRVRTKNGNTAFTFSSPAVADEQLWNGFSPVPNWRSARQGRKTIDVDFSEQQPVYPRVVMSMQDRLRFWGENVFLFFFSPSWPEDIREGSFFCLETFMTRIWMPLFLAVALLIVAWRVFSLPTLLFLTMSLALLFQQTSIMEGRYRKPLECVAIVAALDILRVRFLTHCNHKRQSDRARPD
jgi:hypothetical protein